MIDNKIELFHAYAGTRRIKLNLTRHFGCLYGIKQKKR